MKKWFDFAHHSLGYARDLPELAEGKKNNRLTMLISVLILLIVVLFIQIFQSNPKQVNNYQVQLPVNEGLKVPSKTERWYHSSILKFSILVPADYTIEDQQITVNLIKNGDQITISRNGTNYQNLNDYIKYFDSKRELILFNVIKMKINDYDSLSRIVKFPKQNIQYKSIYLFVINQVFIFSTSSPSLFPDLDRIAQSFSYIP